jgi:hypothetical protein
MKKPYMIPAFPAPPALEEQIIAYCLNVLGIPFGDFWYKYFPSNNPENAVLHIDSSVIGLGDNIRVTFQSFFGASKLFKVNEIYIPKDSREHDEFPVQYYIHYKIGTE